MRNILYQITIEEDKPLLKKTGVYQIRNKENNKVYIGSTSKKLSKRLSSHIRELINNKHHSLHLQNSFNLDKRFERFEISILEICDPSDCLKQEQKWIDLYTPYDDRFGYNISPTAGSCLGIKKSKENKIKLFERLRKLTDEQIIEIFNCRNNFKLSNQEISKKIGISPNQIAAILTKPEKYQYVKEKYNLKLEIKHEKKFTKEDILVIHNLYEDQKLSIRDISELTNFEIIPLRHLIYKENLYKEEKKNITFDIEKKRKNKVYERRKRTKGIKINRQILPESLIFEIFSLKYDSNLTNQDISTKTNINLKSIDLILTFQYQRRKYNHIYLKIKTEYNLRQKRTTLSKNDIIQIFEDYNSGKYLIKELNEKYNFYDVGIFFTDSERLPTFYCDIIQKNNLKVDKTLTKNSEIKSKSIIDRNKKRSKKYKLIDPSGKEIIIKNLAEFCRDTDLDPANFSRISKNGRTYRGWKCHCLD